MISEINFELKIQSTYFDAGQPRRRDLSTRKKKLVYLSRPNKMTPSGRDLNKE